MSTDLESRWCGVHVGLPAVSGGGSCFVVVYLALVVRPVIGRMMLILIWSAIYTMAAGALYLLVRGLFE